MENTLILLKPDCVDRHLSGDIISRFEKKGLRVVALKMMQVTPELARKHYDRLVDRPFFPDLLDYITAGPVIAMILRGMDSVEIVRRMVGATDGAKAQPGSIRGDYSMCVRFNIIHASDCRENADREIDLFFEQNEIFERRDPFWQRKWS